MAENLGGIFINQFENTSNFQAHFITTGPEIWSQTDGNVNCFVMSSGEIIDYICNGLYLSICYFNQLENYEMTGTGGTIAGVSTYLKSKNPDIKCILADPIGSSLYHRVKNGVCFAREQTERKIRKHRYDSIVEGVGLDRITRYRNNNATLNIN